MGAPESVPLKFRSIQDPEKPIADFLGNFFIFTDQSDKTVVKSLVEITKDKLIFSLFLLASTMRIS